MRSRVLRIIFKILALLTLFATTSRPSLAGVPGDVPPAPAQAEGPIPIFLNAPADLDAFWKAITRPDFVILEGDLYRKLQLASELPRVADASRAAIVESVGIGGVVSDDWARLVVEFQIDLASDGPTWVLLQLDGLTLTSARDGSGELAARNSDGRSWKVELKGQGKHLVRVSLLAPVRATTEGRKIEMAIPAAASTRVDLVVPRDVIQASTGAGEVLSVEPVGDKAGSKLTARLSPRSRLDLTWQERVDPALQLPSLMSAQGEIILEVERGSIRSKSSWIVGSIRGSVSQLILRLDSAEELLDLEVDAKPVQVETRRDGSRTVVTIPLAEPLRPIATRTLVMNTRRSIASSGATRISFQGYSFDQAKVQAGLIAVARTGPIFLNPTPGRGLRRIDPRTELPESLRGRQDTNLAFEFDEQPFELGLAIEPSPPRLRVESRTSITVAPRSARLQTRLDCRTSQGRVFEIQVVLPRGLELEGVEPASVVESTQIVSLDPKDASLSSIDVARVMTLSLTPQARESDAFTILLKGWSAIDPSGPVDLPLFRPLVDSAAGGQYAIITDRNVSVDLRPGGEASAAFRPDWGSPPADWVWPSRKPGPELGLTWVLCDSVAESMPLLVTVRPRSIRLESTVAAVVDRRGVDVVDEISGSVAFGAISKLDVAIPREVPARWDVEGVELAGREPLGQEADGSRRYRLRFARDLTNDFRFRIRYRLEVAGSREKGGQSRSSIAPIRILEGTSTSHRLLVSASEPGVELAVDAKGWDVSSVDDPSFTPTDSGPPVRFRLTRIGESSTPVEIMARESSRFPMPSVVVSRLWLRTVQQHENNLATSARIWVESRDGSMLLGLPTGSRWIRARVGSVALVEGDVTLVAADEYRLQFPASTPGGPILVSVDFEVPAASTADGWPPLRVLGGGIIQQTLWEAQIVGTRAALGTPTGWTNENEWTWTGVFWKRRPWKSPLEISNWLTAGNVRYRLPELLESGEAAGRQSYLFSRVGPPTPLRLTIVPRFTLLFLCSGPVLAMGLLILARRPPPRVIGSALMLLAFTAGWLIEPNSLVLVLQSSALGAGLLFSACVMNWAIEWRGRAESPFGEAALIAPSVPVGSTLSRSLPLDVDESTAIRPRPMAPSVVSTADHFVLLRPPAYPSEDHPATDRDER